MISIEKKKFSKIFLFFYGVCMYRGSGNDFSIDIPTCNIPIANIILFFSPYPSIAKFQINDYLDQQDELDQREKKKQIEEEVVTISI
jgi:hypothetical protein